MGNVVSSSSPSSSLILLQVLFLVIRFCSFFFFLRLSLSHSLSPCLCWFALVSLLKVLLHHCMSTNAAHEERREQTECHRHSEYKNRQNDCSSELRLRLNWRRSKTSCEFYLTQTSFLYQRPREVCETNARKGQILPNKDESGEFVRVSLSLPPRSRLLATVSALSSRAFLASFTRFFVSFILSFSLSPPASSITGTFSTRETHRYQALICLRHLAILLQYCVSEGNTFLSFFLFMPAATFAHSTCSIGSHYSREPTDGMQHSSAHLATRGNRRVCENNRCESNPFSLAKL